MSMKCFWSGHDTKKMLAVDDLGASVLAKKTPHAVIPYIPVFWCRRCGKVFGQGWMKESRA